MLNKDDQPARRQKRNTVCIGVGVAKSKSAPKSVRSIEDFITAGPRNSSRRTSSKRQEMADLLALDEACNKSDSDLFAISNPGRAHTPLLKASVPNQPSPPKFERRQARATMARHNSEGMLSIGSNIGMVPQRANSSSSLLRAIPGRKERRSSKQFQQNAAWESRRASGKNKPPVQKTLCSQNLQDLIAMRQFMEGAITQMAQQEIGKEDDASGPDYDWKQGVYLRRQGSFSRAA